MARENQSGLAPSRKKRAMYHEENHAETPPAFNISDRSHVMDAQVPRDEFPEETRSVCSISNHMEQLGRDNSMNNHTMGTGSEIAEPEATVSANTSGTNSSLDARIQALSDMNAEERCSQLNQDAIAGPSSEVPMDADFLNCSDDDETAVNQDLELQTLLNEAQDRAQDRAVIVEELGPDADMPELEGSEIDFETK